MYIIQIIIELQDLFSDRSRLMMTSKVLVRESCTVKTVVFRKVGSNHKKQNL